MRRFSFSSVVRMVSRLLGVAAVVVLIAGATGVVTPLVMLGVALVAPGVARRSAIWLRPSPQRLYARQAFIEAESAKTFQKRFRRGNSRPKVLRKVPSAQPSPKPYAARPTVLHSVVGPGEYARACRSLSWTGSTLMLTDRRGGTATWATVSGGVLRGTRLRPPAPAPDLGDLFVAEIAATRNRLMPLDRIHLLDRWSRRLTTIPAIGFTEDDLADLAAHAGVAFTLYEIPTRVKASPETLVAALLPRSVRYRRTSGIGPEWRWLEHARFFGRLVTAIAEDTMWDPQADLAMRRAARNRRR